VTDIVILTETELRSCVAVDARELGNTIRA